MRRRPIGSAISMFPCRSRVSRPAKMLPWLSSSSAKEAGSTSGNTASAIISSSLSAATNLVKSTISAQDPPGNSRLYMFVTSAGISFRSIAAMFRRPLVLADCRRPWRILAWDWSSLRWLKGSVLRPKSKVLSLGTKGDLRDSKGVSSRDSNRSFDVGIWLTSARFSDLALAICSRRAADDLR